jgi:hypothetical protein
MRSNSKVLFYENHYKNPATIRRPIARRQETDHRETPQTILDNLPEGFEESISYGMIGYGVPHRLYPPATIATPNCHCLL